MSSSNRSLAFADALLLQISLSWFCGFTFSSSCMVSQSFSSVAQSCLTLCNPMDCSTPGFPVLHHLLELAQTHVYRVSDAIQPSHPLSSPSPPAFSILSIRVFSKELALGIRWPKYWSFSFSISPSNEYSELISFRIDWFDLLSVQGDSQESSPAPHFKHINSSGLILLYGPALTSVNDYS